MQVEQLTAHTIDALKASFTALDMPAADWVLIFAAPSFFIDPTGFAFVQTRYPNALCMGCSTAGEITASGLDDGSCTMTLVKFSSTRLAMASTALSAMDDSQAAGQRLGAALAPDGLRAVFVLAQGVAINGSALSRGLTEVLGAEVPVSGGLAGDGAAFTRTWVMSNGNMANDHAVAVGFYGERLVHGFGSFGGWRPFGPARKVTRCEGNVLYELDNEPALDIYRKYLGEYADGLPASGLLFPFLMMRADMSESGLIRTILGIDSEQKSLILAGEISANGYLRLMHSDTNSLVSGAERAANAAATMLSETPAALAILVSCVGRKLAMGDLVDEEIEVTANLLGEQCVLSGFYSYGEICPMAPNEPCKLHNQTMTITVFAEH